MQEKAAPNAFSDRHELWKTGSHVLIYKYNRDDSKLVRLPAEDPGLLIELLKEILDDDREES